MIYYCQIYSKLGAWRARVFGTLTALRMRVLLPEFTGWHQMTRQGGTVSHGGENKEPLPQMAPMRGNNLHIGHRLHQCWSVEFLTLALTTFLFHLGIVWILLFKKGDFRMDFNTLKWVLVGFCFFKETNSNSGYFLVFYKCLTLTLATCLIFKKSNSNSGYFFAFY